jgi:hypothetical protein
VVLNPEWIFLRSTYSPPLSTLFVRASERNQPSHEMWLAYSTPCQALADEPPPPRANSRGAAAVGAGRTHTTIARATHIRACSLLACPREDGGRPRGPLPLRKSPVPRTSPVYPRVTALLQVALGLHHPHPQCPLGRWSIWLGHSVACRPSSPQPSRETTVTEALRSEKARQGAADRNQ